MTREGEDWERQAERSATVTPRIYVASLSDYNAGRLHGEWIDAAQEVEALHDQVEAMLSASPMPSAEEWAIHDFEGFGSFQPSEYEALEWISAVARGIVEHGNAYAAFAAYLNDQPERLSDFAEAYRGHWESATQYADELLDELGATEVLEQVPEWLQPYITLNVESFARDLQIGGDICVFEGDGGVWVFYGAI